MTDSSNKEGICTLRKKVPLPGDNTSRTRKCSCGIRHDCSSSVALDSGWAGWGDLGGGTISPTVETQRPISLEKINIRERQLAALLRFPSLGRSQLVAGGYVWLIDEIDAQRFDAIKASLNRRCKECSPGVYSSFFTRFVYNRSYSSTIMPLNVKL